MRIFISWSGERSQALAQALREWLPLVLYYAQPWLSKSDIAAGERWGMEVAKELDGSNFGIICVTRENINAPWILFEAGALAKFMEEGRVIPLLLDVEFKDISGPLAQFQAKKVERGGLSDVVTAINSSAPQPAAQATRLFESLWPQFEEQIKAIPEPTAPSKATRPQHEVLEELVASVRGLDVRLRDDDEFRSRRRRRLPPTFFIRQFRHSFLAENSPMAMLLAASAVRDDIPWLYELGMEVYRAPPGSSQDRTARRRLGAALKALQKLPEEILFEPEGIRLLSREIEEIEKREPDMFG